MTSLFTHYRNLEETKEVKICIRLGHLHSEKAAMNCEEKYRAGKTVGQYCQNKCMWV